MELEARSSEGHSYFALTRCVFRLKFQKPAYSEVSWFNSVL